MICGHFEIGRAWPIPLITSSLRAGNAFGGVDAAGERHQRVDVAVDDEGRHANPAERRLAAARCKDRHQLAGDAGRVQAAA